MPSPFPAIANKFALLPVSAYICLSAFMLLSYICSIFGLSRPDSENKFPVQSSYIVRIPVGRDSIKDNPYRTNTNYIYA